MKTPLNFWRAITWCLVACVGGACTSAEFAAVAAEQNRVLTDVRNVEADQFVLAMDRRQRSDLEEKLSLWAMIGELELEATFERDLASVQVEATTRPSDVPSAHVTTPAMRALMAKYARTRESNAERVREKRKAAYLVLDAELAKWLADPKKKQQERVAIALAVYAREQSEFARFVNEIYGTAVGEVK